MQYPHLKISTQIIECKFLLINPHSTDILTAEKNNQENGRTTGSAVPGIPKVARSHPSDCSSLVSCGLNLNRASGAQGVLPYEDWGVTAS